MYNIIYIISKYSIYKLLTFKGVTFFSVKVLSWSGSVFIKVEVEGLFKNWNGAIFLIVEVEQCKTEG